MRTLVAILALAADALLIGPKGELLGIGSLIVADADGQGGGQKPGNMFVPIDLLKPFSRIWSRGAAGVDVALRVLRGAQVRSVTVRSVDRAQYFKGSTAY